MLVRPQQSLILNDLEKKMVFLTGPRQVGKTWLAHRIAEAFEGSVYLNYDSFDDREVISRRAWLDDTPLIVLDELHKMPNWKNFLKGIYDTKPPGLRILVTGSARLDTFRQGGDSLAGRFLRHRLAPFTLADLPNPTGGNLDRLVERGGFPEPFLADSAQDAQRWRLQYADGLLRGDILDFERVHDLRALSLMVELLQHRVGSPVSFSSLARDVGIAPNTAKRYLQIFEALFIVFSVSPYSRNIARSLLKEPKVYFYDTGLVRGDDGARFENAVAVSLLKHVQALEDQQGQAAQLHYLRTKDGREVDFCLVVDDTAQQLIEAKLSDKTADRNLRYFHDRHGTPAVQLVKRLRLERKQDAIEVRSATRYLAALQP